MYLEAVINFFPRLYEKLEEIDDDLLTSEILDNLEQWEKESHEIVDQELAWPQDFPKD